ncbi:MAG: shikimate kinase [Sphingomonadales bacterium]|nr:shikimate kinase [Sphingomonadales bacterium]
MTAALPSADAATAAALARRLDRPVVLVGMMGVGKSSVGRRLAVALGVPFVDADDAIEEAAQMSIPDIFAQYGEGYFRDGERRVIARLLGSELPAGTVPPVSVIATGGGAFVNPETRALILDRAVAVWLDAELDTLVERTARKNNRPLLQQGNPRETLARLRADRAPAYAQAHVHVISHNGPHHRTMSQVLRSIGAWLDRTNPE